MSWLVTGSTGFLGAAVASALESALPGESVIRARRPRREVATAGTRVLPIDLERIHPAALAEWLDTLSIDRLIHCAGRTPPATPANLWSANVRATACLVDACRCTGRPIRVVLVGSAAELGPVPASHLPADETCDCRPVDAYGLSKWAASRLGRAASSAGGLVEVVVGRVFNLIGPGLPVSQVFGRFARTLAQRGTDPIVLNVSDLEAKRDFVDVRDAASALILLAQAGRTGEIYHIATGVAHSIGEGLGVLLRASGQPAVVRHADRPPTGAALSVASIRKIQSELGWTPNIDFEQSLEDLSTWAALQVEEKRHVA
jgi:GDP-4-dehydro-6-deoxy-D-mannose reductase